MAKTKIQPTCTVYQTRDYSVFKRVPGNRPLNETHVKQLMTSYLENYVFRAVLVNEFMQVIDGQHGVEACKRLELPVWYKIEPGLGLADAIRMNKETRIWVKPEYNASFCELKIEGYLKLKEFMKNYPDFKQGVAESIITNEYVGKKVVDAPKDAHGKKLSKSRIFKEGQMKVTNIVLAYENASKIMAYKPYFKRYNTGVFVRAMLTIFNNNPKFDNDVMLRKLSYQPSKLIPCTNVEDYKDVIESIYNWKSQNPIRLK